MAVVTQVADQLLDHLALTNAATAAGLSFTGPEVDVQTRFSITVYVYHAIVEALANNPGIDYVLQGRWTTGSGLDEDWQDIWTFSTGTVAAVASEITGTEAAGETTLAVDADPTAAFSPGDRVYIQDTGTVNAGEWSRVAISATGPDIVTIVDGLTNAKDSADTIWTQAELLTGSFDVTGVRWVRMIIVGRDTTGANTHSKAEMVSFSAIT